MPLLRSIPWFLGVACLVFITLPALAEPLRTKHVTAELLLENRALQPGQADNWVGLRLEMIPHWHTYWRFPGDSGLPTEVEWELPAGWKAGPPQWPHPQRLFVPPLVNYGYEGAALIGFRFEIPASEAAGTRTIAAKVSWLVCKEECIPEEGRVVLTVKVAKGKASADIFAGLFSALRAQQPRALPPGSSVKIVYENKRLGLMLQGLPALEQADFLPLAPQIVKGDAPPVAEKGLLWLERSDPFDKAATTLPGVLTGKSGGKPVAFELNAPLPLVAPAPSAAAAAEPEEKPSAWLAALLALLGGLILNLMPCVFPVLGIKVMSLVKQGQGERSHVRRHGHAYALGVLACFWALALALVALRGLGERVGWGFQLQQPIFVTLLVLLFSFVAADLGGFVRWSGRWMGAGAGLANKDGTAGSFFTGVLAVVVATPCTAPFMGTAMGAAIGEPAPVVFLVFTALGAGLALPFVFLCYQPRFLKLLPRPGAWMEKLKELLAFPMAATVLWLLWVLSLQVGTDGVLKVEFGLLLLLSALWLWNRFHSALGTFCGWLLIAGGIAVAVWGALSPAPGLAAVTGDWKPYSDAALAEAQATGRPVFVDFTAAWCLTCQVNKKLVLDRSGVQEYLREKKVALLLADWTNRDPVITKALERQGRIGVPLYLAYTPGRLAPAILPQVLTENILRETFP